MAMNEPSLSVRDQLRNRLTGLRTRLGKFIPFFSGVLGALLALYIYNALSPETQMTRTDVNDAVASALASATPRPPNSVAVYQIIQPSLVLIETEGEDANGEFGQSLGSGVIINERGEILTSLHVVDGASRISVTFADGTKAEGAIINAQPEIDIAMLATSVLPELYVPATIGNAGAMQVGDDAYVVGNPFGLYGSMSSGVISGFDRVYRPPELPNVIRGLIQVDAAINPGNSGGPLLNRSGHVVGIVTGIINPTEDSFFIGIGFAVPISVAAGGAGGMPPY
jgi:S1-C subfamily serine protease